ncbi:MAG: carbohydrate ABC transporter permease [Clostridia bacterium]|nr:carbohydrate ABC transporter permease [Clostridia bacterium]MBQ4452968.1 carbohydrate ABC transporter permease [Clostridia bacterium]
MAREKKEKVRSLRYSHTAIGRFLTDKHTNRSVSGSATLLVFLTVFALISLFPVVFMVSNAFKPINELFIYPPRLFFIQPTTSNFSELFAILADSLVPFLRYLFNTLFIVITGCVGHIVLSSMAAFPLAKFRFPGSELMSRIIVYSLMFTSSVTAVPTYMIMSRLHLVDTYWAVIFPAFSLPLGLFLMKNFMEQVPTALIDAASIDGSSYFGMLWRIIMPAVKPAWITLFIVCFQGLWGNSAGNFIYSESKKPLAAMLQNLSGSGVARTGVVAASSLFMFVVPLIAFIISQSNVMETMATSGIKE